MKNLNYEKILSIIDNIENSTLELSEEMLDTEIGIQVLRCFQTRQAIYIVELNKILDEVLPNREK